MYDHIYTHIWMLVPHEERQVLVEAFDLSKSGRTEVRDSDVITDGYTNDDLAAITAERMAAYVGSDEPFMRLWELTVAKARSIVHPAQPFPQLAAEKTEEQIPAVQEALPANTETHDKESKAAAKKK
jgi:hypothetical protein